jgi:hypothetical protein
MPRIRFTRDFDFKPTRSVTIAYLAGMECVVTRDCARQAFGDGKAVAVASVKEPADAQAANNR